MAEAGHRVSRNPVRWPHVVAAALVSALSATMPLGMLWLSPMLLVAWWGRRHQVWGALVLSWLLLGLLIAGSGATGSTLALQFVQPAGLTVAGLVFAIVLFKRASVSWAGLAAVASVMVLSGIAVAWVAQSQGSEFERNLQVSVASVLDTTVAQLEDQGTHLDKEALSRFVAFVEAHALWVAYLAPGIMGIGLLSSLWINLLVAGRMAPGVIGLGSLSDWRPPDEWIWGVIVAALLAFTRITPLVVVGVNVLLVGLGAYWLSGVAVGAVTTRRWGLPGWAYALVLALLFLTGGLPYLAFVGLLDFWLDFRKRWRIEE